MSESEAKKPIEGEKAVQFNAYQIKHCIFGQSDLVSIIECLIMDEKTKTITDLVGYINFYKKGKVRGKSTVDEIGRFTLNCEIDRYPDIIKTLRSRNMMNLSANIRWDQNRNIILGYIRVIERTTGG
jgi:hypothetical protein